MITTEHTNLELFESYIDLSSVSAETNTCQRCQVSFRNILNYYSYNAFYFQNDLT